MMGNAHIFISHATQDDDYVKELRRALESCGIPVWVDSRNLRGGDKLVKEIETAIEEARQVLVVLTPNTVNSPWVKREIDKALQVELGSGNDFRVIPLLLPGIAPSALGLWFVTEPLGVRVEMKSWGLQESMPKILSALGEILPEDFSPHLDVEEKPLEDLVLQLVDARVIVGNDNRVLTATASLTYYPADSARRSVESRRYNFEAPLGPIDRDDLRWYLEDYFRWPVGPFRDRALGIEGKLPIWGRQLHDAALGNETVHEAVEAWRHSSTPAERRFSVLVDDAPALGSSDEEARAVREASSALLALPWELLHDTDGYLFQGRNGTRVRRRLPNRSPQDALELRLPIRVLLISPRPEDKRTGYIDHRTSALALLDALESLGDLVQFKVVTPGTLPALETELLRAADLGEPYHVVHFDGQGFFDKESGLGGLCFEDPKDADKFSGRESHLVLANVLAAILRNYRIPLVFLEACQSAVAEMSPTESVAARLLEGGVASVVAMTHSVLAETARRFVAPFYSELAKGTRVGRAMLAGQKSLHGDPYRFKVMGAGDLNLQDWFVPVLYQEQQDPVLVSKLPSTHIRQFLKQRREAKFGELPKTPAHRFVGRGRELLGLERRLERERYVVIQGMGGSGKTAVAVELAGWLVRSDRFERCAFVCVEYITDTRGVLDAIGRQLVPGNYSVAQYAEIGLALQPVERALREHRTLIVLDNFESVLPDASGRVPPEAPLPEELFQLCQTLLKANTHTRIIFTSREVLPEPFGRTKNQVNLGSLSCNDAIELVANVLSEAGLVPNNDDQVKHPQEIVDLVEAVGCHARALVLIAPEVSREGVRGTSGDIGRIVARLESRLRVTNSNDALNAIELSREASLFASIELSIRRLPSELRESIDALSVFQGGGHVSRIAYVGGAEETKALEAGLGSAAALVGVGLGVLMEHGYLRVDPALPAYLSLGIEAERIERYQGRLVDVMEHFVGFLYQQQTQDTRLSAQLTLLELPNILMFLDLVDEHGTPERNIAIAGSVESLLSQLARPRALAHATALRRSAMAKLQNGPWSRVVCRARAIEIELLLDRGAARDALSHAEKLYEQCHASGKEAYPEADYDLAIVGRLLGRALEETGEIERALELFADSRKRLLVSLACGNTNALRMASTLLTDLADCQMTLGLHDTAEENYLLSIVESEKQGNIRGAAVARGNLAMLRLEKGDTASALEGYAQARATFEILGEPRTVAGSWHQIGTVHKKDGNLVCAQEAFRESLAINVREGFQAEEATNLAELGAVSYYREEYEDSVTYTGRASSIFARLGLLRREADTLRILVGALVRLGRRDEARRELDKVFERKASFGKSGEIWKAWSSLCDLERAESNLKAAESAWRSAVRAYLEYRRSGGAAQTTGAQVCLALQYAQETGGGKALSKEIIQLLGESNLPEAAFVLLKKLELVLSGERDPAIANDCNLSFSDAAELLLTLETLGVEIPADWINSVD